MRRLLDLLAAIAGLRASGPASQLATQLRAAPVSSRMIARKLVAMLEGSAGLTPTAEADRTGLWCAATSAAALLAAVTGANAVWAVASPLLALSPLVPFVAVSAGARELVRRWRTVRDLALERRALEVAREMLELGLGAPLAAAIGEFLSGGPPIAAFERTPLGVRRRLAEVEHLESAAQRHLVTLRATVTAIAAYVAICTWWLYVGVLIDAIR